MSSRMSIGCTILLLCLVASASLLFFTGSGILHCILRLVAVLAVGLVGLGWVYAWYLTRGLTHAMAAGELAPSQQAGSPPPVNAGQQRLGRVTVRHRADLL